MQPQACLAHRRVSAQPRAARARLAFGVRLATHPRLRSREVAAEIRQQVETQGQPIGMADYLIAAVCIAADGVLLTRNRKPFERIKGLKLSPFGAGEP